MIHSRVEMNPDGTILVRVANRLGTGLAGLLTAPIMSVVAETYRNLLIEGTPSATGKAKGGWVIRTKMATEMVFENTARASGFSYPHLLEFGSDPGKKPWPTEGPKTILASGPVGDRIFSKQAPGGISVPAMEKLSLGSVADTIADSLKRLFTFGG